MNPVNNNATVETVTDDPSITSHTDNKGEVMLRKMKKKVSHILQRMKIRIQKMMKSLKDRLSLKTFGIKMVRTWRNSLRAIIIQRKLISQGKHKAPENESTKRSSLKKKV